MFTTPLAKANDSSEKTNCFSNNQIGSMARYKLSCDIAKSNLESTQRAFQQCLEKKCEPMLDTKALVGVGIGAAVLGAALAVIFMGRN